MVIFERGILHQKIYARHALIDGNKKTAKTPNGEMMQFHCCEKDFWNLNK
jgi:prophage maintenance system killer protein